MWQEISNDREIQCFMDKVCFFHDSCIKELKYISGAYVNADLSMHPINDRRLLSVIIQRQHEDNPMIELEFEGLKFLNLFPTDDMYTCEILDSSMFFKNGYIYWCDHKDLLETDLKNLNGTIICASKLRWRPIANNMGSAEYYLHNTEDSSSC
ncbi:MAG: hypothetical protein HFJ98_07530 [Eubacterium sp.]|nr:hypothetical protein [Eubacterium sp.]